LVRLLRGRLDHYLEHKGSPDSLRYADYFLDQLETYTGEEQWYLSTRAEVSFLYATYADMPDDSAAALYTQGVNAAESYLAASPEILQYMLSGATSVNSISSAEISAETLQGVYWWTV
ncbi:MAG: hypothetical protein GWN14_02385, partial [candidate division Zixibacteria bacterium]|nr:hypothetical protein [Gammaproteobacteria bacterium]NIX54795.1 hypothetical protein [candidate division Zixibacteria bacterium]